MNFSLRLTSVLALVAASAIAQELGSQESPDELQVKRKELFAFAAKPEVTRERDRVDVFFEVQAACDVTVAIESDNRIVRHLASGVLGENAPPPFQKDLLRQHLVWDGKDDQGCYVENIENCKVRVSLGLRPRYERMFRWHPGKRVSAEAPLIQAAPEGVYVFEGKGVDNLKLFNRMGGYVRTVYPFSSSRVESLKGLQWRSALQDGRRLPTPLGYYQSTLLSSGPSGTIRQGSPHGLDGAAASAMAIRDTRIALASYRVNRFTEGGTQSSMPFEGPNVCFESRRGAPPENIVAAPQSAALDPTGKWLFLTGHVWRTPKSYLRTYDPVNIVQKVAMDDSKAEAIPFLGGETVKSSSELGKFDHPASVACDTTGRVYIADYLNDRVQIFSPGGKFLKALGVKRPAVVRIHELTQEVYVFSWVLPDTRIVGEKIPATIACLGTFEQPKDAQIRRLALPGYAENMSQWHGGACLLYTGEIDSWSKPATIWIGQTGELGPFLMQEQNGKFEVIRDFGKEVTVAGLRTRPTPFSKQVLYTNHENGMFYISEPDGSAGPESSTILIEVDPETAKERTVSLPFNAEDIAFDYEGLIYLRSRHEVARYKMDSWREVPFDYGEEREGVGFYGSGKRATLIGGLAGRGINWHMGGLAVSLRRNLAVVWHDAAKSKDNREKASIHKGDGEDNGGIQLDTRLYPGRAVHYKLPVIRVYDKHGMLLYDDALPGLGQSHGGIGIDSEDSLYIMASSTRIYDGKLYPNKSSGTMLKVRPGKARVLSMPPHESPVPLDPKQRPQRSPDLEGKIEGRAWVEGAEWLFGGVGQNVSNEGFCSCSNSRFAFDNFDRSFAPEMDHFSVAVLDKAGNLILRLGRYGNVEDGQPVVPSGAPALAHAIGGDEVSLFYAPYVAVHTDRRLYVADIGNSRIISIKLEYTDEARIRIGKDGDLSQ